MWTKNEHLSHYSSPLPFLSNKPQILTAFQTVSTISLLSTCNVKCVVSLVLSFYWHSLPISPWRFFSLRSSGFRGSGIYVAHWGVWDYTALRDCRPRPARPNPTWRFVQCKQSSLQQRQLDCHLSPRTQWSSPDATQSNFCQKPHDFLRKVKRDGILPQGRDTSVRVCLRTKRI